MADRVPVLVEFNTMILSEFAALIRDRSKRLGISEMDYLHNCIAGHEIRLKALYKCIDPCIDNISQADLSRLAHEIWASDISGLVPPHLKQMADQMRQEEGPEKEAQSPNIIDLGKRKNGRNWSRPMGHGPHETE
jgi:hypothetical protein